MSRGTARGRSVLVAAGIAVLVSACGGSDPVATPSRTSTVITVADLMAYPVAGVENLVFLEGALTNTSTEPDALLGGASEIGQVEISGTSGCPEAGTTGRFSMPRWGVGPGETIHLVRGSGCITIVGVTALPETGTQIPLTLRFERAGEVALMAAGQPPIQSDDSAGSDTGCAG